MNHRNAYIGEKHTGTYMKETFTIYRDDDDIKVFDENGIELSYQGTINVVTAMLFLLENQL